MIQGLKLIKVSMAIIALSSPLYAQENFQSINLAGTVIAENESGLSYEAQGCITEVSQEAVNSGLAIKDQVLVRLDDRTSQLALKSAQARSGDLKAAVEESEFSITCLLYTSPSPRDKRQSRMPSSA